MRAFVRACVRASVRACERASVRGLVHGFFFFLLAATHLARTHTHTVYYLSSSRYVGHKRIDFPIVDTRTVRVGAVRFNCIASLAAPGEPVYLRSFSLHKKTVPWE
jgi:hypothetical protein